MKPPRLAPAACALLLLLAACSSSALKQNPTGGPGSAGTGSAGTGAAGTGAPAATADRSWIYVATRMGVQRIKAAGGSFETFGVAAETLHVYPSPSGQLVAQELADGRVAVFDGDGAPHAPFDVRRGLLGWSDEGTLLFLDAQTKFLQQTSIDGQTRRYLPLPDGVNAYGYLNAILSPDHSLVAAFAEPWAKDNIQGSYLFVLSATDGTRIRDLGVPGGGGVWTGDGRLLVVTASGQLNLVTPRTGATKSVTQWPTLAYPCGMASWYETGKIVVGRSFFPGGSDTAECARAVLDLSTGQTMPSGEPTFGTPDPGPFALSPDDHEGAFASGPELLVGPVAGGAARVLGTAMTVIVDVGWAHPMAGDAKLMAPPRPPRQAQGLAGAPAATSRSGGTDCGTGRWVNRTPTPLPVGWPAPRTAWSFALDTDRSTLLVEGGLAGSLGTLPNLDYETMEWDGAQGQWTNLSRPDGYGPVMNRAFAYDANHKVVLGQGADLPGDGTWSWTPASGWNNLRATGSYQGPILVSSAASVYDLARDRWIVSGGYVQLSTWEWDGTTWSRSEAGLPGGGTSQGAGASLVYDSKRARVYSVGNRDRGPAPWLYEPDQKRWTAQPSTGPSALPRDWAGVAYDARRDRVMVFGGLLVGVGGSTLADLSEWDPATGAWYTCPTTGAAPSARMNAAFAYDAKRDVLVLYGGDTLTGTPATDVWEWYLP